MMFCNYSISDTVFTPQQVRSMNKENLKELKIGMKENVVLMIMESQTIKIEGAPFTIENPFKIDLFSIFGFKLFILSINLRYLLN